MSDLKAALEGRVAFVSTGTPEGDAEESARIIRRAAYEAEGLCPNGCAPMVALTGTEVVDGQSYEVDGLWRCPSCGCTTNYEPGASR